MLHNPIRRGAQTITPQHPYTAAPSLPKPIVYRPYPYHVGLWFQVQVCHPDISIPKMDVLSERTIRKGSKGLSPQGSAAFLTFSAAWRTVYWNKAFLLLFDISASGGESADKASMLRERLYAWPHCCMCLFACLTTLIILEICASHTPN